jgi:hypothetical protein
MHFCCKGSPFYRENIMSYFGSSQTRTFKIVEDRGFSEVDLAWIRSQVNVSLVTLQKKTIRVLTTTEDSIAKIVDTINKKYCNNAKAKLSPLF